MVKGARFTSPAPSVIFASSFASASLLEVFKKSVLKSGARGRDGISPKMLASDIDTVVDRISKQVLSGSYSFSPFREKLVLKSSTSLPRVISVAGVRDRIALKALANCLSEVTKIGYADLPQRIVAEVVDQLGKSGRESFIRVDVKDFYPSISHDVLLRRLRAYTRKPQLLKLVSEAISTPTMPAGQVSKVPRAVAGVPQGLSISNLLAEIYMKPIDRKLSRRTDISYFRYVDDILILCPSASAAKVSESVALLLGSVGLDIHPFGKGSKSETGLVADGFPFLGYEFNSREVSVRRTSVEKIENRIAKTLTHHKYADARSSGATGLPPDPERAIWWLNLVITGFTLDKKRYGWLNYFSQLTNVEQLLHLDRLVARLIRRQSSLSGASAKKFIQTYWIMRRRGKRSEGYIVNFDNLNDAEITMVLLKYFAISHYRIVRASPDQRREILMAKMQKVILDVEMDVGSPS